MGLDEVWTADLTYIRIGSGFVYLAIILDLYSRRVIGWSVSKRIDGDLAVAALSMAITMRKQKTDCIPYSNRGVQYLCNEYVELLKKHSFWISNSAKGNPYGTAWTERFMRKLKQEEVYNEKRVHFGIDYLTPSELEERVRKDPSNPDNRPHYRPLHSIFLANLVTVRSLTLKSLAVSLRLNFPSK